MKKRAVWHSVLAGLFWIAVWQLESMLIARDFLLASPWDVCCTLIKMIFQAEFWLVVLRSFGRIALGCLLGTVSGVLLAAAAAASSIAEVLLRPLMQVFKTVPVASFIILALLWTGSSGLSVFISFLMVMPVIYTNMLDGIRQTNMQLLEMAQVFYLKWHQKLTAIYLPQLLPHFITGCSVAIGLAFKSGVAAEVIGLPQGTVGEKLYQAKIYLSTGEVFAWTIVVVLLSILLERLIKAALCALQRRLNA